MIDNFRASGDCQIYLTVKMKFLLSKDDGESKPMHSKSNNIEIMIGNDTDEITEELFNLLLHRYQVSLEQSINY